MSPPAHSCWDAERPATLSEWILTQQLRLGLGFEGLIVTDALVMGAIANRWCESCSSLGGGSWGRYLLMPVDPEGAIQAV